MGAGQRDTDLRIQLLLSTVHGASAFLLTSLAIWLGFEQRTWMEAILPVLAGALSFAIAFAPCALSGFLPQTLTCCSEKRCTYGLMG